MKVLKLVSLLILPFAFAACKKEPGTGGKTTLSGKIMGNYYCDEDSSLLELGTPIPDERVYISYGATGEIDDDARTAPDGTFKFEFLHPGTYSLMTYSECLSCPTGKVVVTQEIEINKKEEEVTLSDFNVDRYTGRGCPTEEEKLVGPGEGGNKSIRGFVTTVYINEDNINDTIGKSGESDIRVYIIYGDGNLHSDDVRTSLNGEYEFKELLPGSYQVYAISECRTLQCPSEEQPIKVNVTIGNNDDLVRTPEIVILDFKKR